MFKSEDFDFVVNKYANIPLDIKYGKAKKHEVSVRISK